MKLIKTINKFTYRQSANQKSITIRACTGFDGGLEVGEAIRSGTLR